MTRLCSARRRIGELETLQHEIDAWSNDVNDKQRGVDWQMKIDDARCKLNPFTLKLNADRPLGPALVVCSEYRAGLQHLPVGRASTTRLR